MSADSATLPWMVGTWHHVAVRRSGTNFAVYFDGAEVATLVSAADLAANASLKLGHRGIASDTPGSTDVRPMFLNGGIDDLRLYNRALSVAEIQSLEFGLTQPPAGLNVLEVSPKAGGDTGTVSLSLHGYNFRPGAIVRLAGPSSVDADHVVASPDGRNLIARFNLVGKTHGLHDVVVVNQDGQIARLDNSFLVESGKPIDIWVDIISSPLTRIGRTQKVYVAYGNRGNTDIPGVPIWIGGIPEAADIAPARAFASLPADMAAEPIQLASVPEVVVSNGKKVLPLLVVAPANSVNLFEVNISVPTAGSFAIEAWTADCWSPIADEIMSCLGEVIKKGAEEALSLTIPDACYQAALSSMNSLLNYALNGTGFQGQPSIWPSFSLTKVSLSLTNNIVKCAAQTGALVGAPWAKIVAKFVALVSKGVGYVDLIEKCGRLINELKKKFAPTTVVGSIDPNEKFGRHGSGTANYTSGRNPMNYSVSFENLASASAPAQDVIVTDRLPVDKLDVNTFGFGPIAFDTVTLVPPPGLNEFSTVVDLRPNKDIIVLVDAKLDKRSGDVTWRLISLDPSTGFPPTDPLKGFLPPNVIAPQGEGRVSFSVSPRPALSTGEQIRNQARIVFDINTPIDTGIWINTIDNSDPSSQVQSLPVTQSANNFSVQWSGTDSGACILDYTVYVAEDGGPFAVWLPNTTANSGTFTGTPGKSYAFYTVAQDRAGNREVAPTSADATTRILADTTPPTTAATPSPTPNAAGWNNANATVALSATDATGGQGVKEIVYTLSGAQTGGSTVTGSTASVSITAEGTTTLTYFARDNAGNQETAKTLTVKIDKTAPAVTASARTADGAAYTGGTTTQAVTVSFACTDAGSGVASLAATGAASGNATSSPLAVTVSADGMNQAVMGTCTDAAGNTGSASFSGITIARDQAAPPAGTTRMSRSRSPPATG